MTPTALTMTLTAACAGPSPMHVEFARECAEEWRVERVTVRVDQRRATLPQNRRPGHDGPTWTIRPVPPRKG